MYTIHLRRNLIPNKTDFIKRSGKHYVIKDITLPFVPKDGIIIEDCRISFSLSKVTWDTSSEDFTAECTPLYAESTSHDHVLSLDEMIGMHTECAGWSYMHNPSFSNVRS